MDHGHQIWPRNVWDSTINTSWWHRELSQLQQASIWLQISLDLSYWKISVFRGFLCLPAPSICPIDLFTFCFAGFGDFITLLHYITLHGVNQSWPVLSRVYVIGLVGKHATTHHTHPVFHINDRHVRHAACVNSVTCRCTLYSSILRCLSSAYLILVSGLFGFFFQPEQYFFLTTFHLE